MRFVRFLPVFALLFGAPAWAALLEGRISGTDGTPMALSFVATLTSEFAAVESASTGLDGGFSLPYDTQEGYLVVQPPARPDASGLQVHPYQPRLIALGVGEGKLDLKLPPAFTMAIEAYSPEGELLRWEDFERLGMIGGQFAYATNLDDESIPMTVWPVHGERLTGMDSGPREKGLPSVLVAPGERAAVTVLYWPVKDYGKLLVRADNAGAGFMGENPGDSVLLLLNYELARTAVHDLLRRRALFPGDAQEAIDGLASALEAAAGNASRVQRARAADQVLSDALKLRDRLEVARARAMIPSVRQGTLEVRLEGPTGTDFSGHTVRVEQQRRDFLFGVFEGSPYDDRADRAFRAAREGGFEFATVLLGWNWTQSPQGKVPEIDRIFGLSRLKDLGYTVKAHGVLWLQGHHILPDKAFGMPHDQLTAEALAHQEALIDTFDRHIDIWEVINEPANTNVVDLPRPQLVDLIGSAMETIEATGKPTLINSPHEFSYGGKYLIHKTDGTPLNPHPETFSAFLEQVRPAGVLDGVDILGLQFYPGFHLSAAFEGLQGPAYTPAYFLDTLDRYARFGKAVHITEFSIPSNYGRDWFSGYWREPWTEETQADYAEMVYTLAFAHPAVQSMGWWDISDEKPSIETGGLLRPNGDPKPVFERLTGLLADWRTAEEAQANAEGSAAFRVYGGTHDITVTAPDGTTFRAEAQVYEGWTRSVVVRVE